MIIGLTGTIGAGKGTAAKYLESRGFVYHSCSDILREILKKQSKEETRDNLRNLGNEIREKCGYGELAKRLLDKIYKNKEKKAIIDSIRHPKEIEELRKNKDFVLISIDAPIELRYKRVKARQRASDFVSFDKFKSDEEKEMQDKGASQQIGICVKLADYIVINDKDFKEFYRKIDDILAKK